MGFVNQLRTGGGLALQHFVEKYSYQVIILKQGGVLWGYNGDTTYITKKC